MRKISVDQAFDFSFFFFFFFFFSVFSPAKKDSTREEKTSFTGLNGQDIVKPIPFVARRNRRAHVMFQMVLACVSNFSEICLNIGGFPGDLTASKKLPQDDKLCFALGWVKNHQ